MNTTRSSCRLLPFVLALAFSACAAPPQASEPSPLLAEDSGGSDTSLHDASASDAGDVGQGNADANVTDGRSAHGDLDGTGSSDSASVGDTGAATLDAPESDAPGDDGSDSGSLDSGSSDSTSSGGTSVGTCPKGPPPTCSVAFVVQPTTPVAQTYVAVSGDFLYPTWPGTVAKGAQALTFDSSSKTWRVTLQLPHGRVLAYKYIAGWQDNPGPVWFNQAGKFEGAANSVRVVDCAALACGQQSSRAALVAATLQAHGDDVRASQGLIGLGVGVVVDGEVAALGGFGKADKDKGVAVNPQQTRFRWASVSKTVTGALAAQLAVNKKLVLDSDATAALSSYPAPTTYAVPCTGGTKTWQSKSYPCLDGWFSLPLNALPSGEGVVTYRQLLGHLGGIVHYSNGPKNPTPPASQTGDPKTNTGVAWALSYLQNQPLIALPGTAYHYSSFGFNLVGAAIGASQQSTMEALAQAVFWGPLQLTSIVPDREWLPIPHRAKGYWKGADGTILPQGSSDVSWKLPGGGYVSTIADLAGWCRGLAGDQVLGADAKALAWTAQKTKAGKSTGYGLGFSRGSKSGKAYVSHSGSQQKVRSNLRLYLDEKLCIVLATNSSWASVSTLNSKLESLVRASLAAAAAKP